MDAYISATSEVAILVEGDERWFLKPTSKGGECKLLDPTMWHMTGWSQAQDYYVLKNTDRATALKELDVATKSWYTNYLAITLLDPEASDKLMKIAVEELQELIADPQLRERAERLLYAMPMPPVADAQRAIKYCAGTPLVEFFEKFVAAQPAIAEVSRVWTQEAATHLSVAESRAARAEAVRTGMLSDLAKKWHAAAQRGDGSVEAVKSKTASTLREHATRKDFANT